MSVCQPCHQCHLEVPQATYWWFQSSFRELSDCEAPIQGGMHASQCCMQKNLRPSQPIWFSFIDHGSVYIQILHVQQDGSIRTQLSWCLHIPSAADLKRDLWDSMNLEQQSHAAPPTTSTVVHIQLHSIFCCDPRLTSCDSIMIHFGGMSNRRKTRWDRSIPRRNPDHDQVDMMSPWKLRHDRVGATGWIGWLWPNHLKLLRYCISAYSLWRSKE